MPYNGENFYCPRTKSKMPYIDGPVLKMWKRYSDAVAQFKMDGNRNVIKVFPDRKVEFWRRRREEDTQFEQQIYEIPAKMKEQVLSISPVDQFTVWDTELLHFKTKEVKNVIYFFDCLVWQSEHLLGWTYEDRFKLCQDALGEKFMPMKANLISEHCYIAQNFKVEDWDNRWIEAKAASFCEGLVLKRMGNSSRLTFGSQIVNNAGFMVRCRKEKKNYYY